MNCLLDFLGEPTEDRLKGSSKTKKAAATTSQTKSSGNDEDYEAIEPGTMPNDAQLRQWTRAYVRCFNMESVTIKSALEVAGDKFGVDLSSKKQRLKELIAEEM